MRVATWAQLWRRSSFVLSLEGTFYDSMNDKKILSNKNSSKQFFLRYFYEQWRQFIRIRLKYTHLVRDENFRLFVIYLRKIGKKRKTEYLRIHKRIKRNRRRQERRKEGRDGRTDGAVTSRNRVDPVGRLAKLEGHCELSLILELVTARWRRAIEFFYDFFYSIHFKKFQNFQKHNFL